jgi:hypothetical protein
MHDALGMCGLERFHNLTGDRERLVERYRRRLDAIRERLALDELHDQRAVLDPVDRRDIRMIQ